MKRNGYPKEIQSFRFSFFSVFFVSIGNLLDFYSQLNNTNTSGTKTPFLDLNSSVSNDIISTEIYDKQENFDFYTVYSVFGLRCFLVLHPVMYIILS